MVAGLRMRLEIKIDIFAVGLADPCRSWSRIWKPFHYSQLTTCESLWVRSLGLALGWVDRGVGRREGEGGRGKAGRAEVVHVGGAHRESDLSTLRSAKENVAVILKGFTDVCSRLLTRLKSAASSFIRREHLQAPMNRWISPGNWQTSSCWCSSQRKVSTEIHSAPSIDAEKVALSPYLFYSCDFSWIARYITFKLFGATHPKLPPLCASGWKISENNSATGSGRDVSIRAKQPNFTSACLMICVEAKLEHDDVKCKTRYCCSWHFVQILYVIALSLKAWARATRGESRADLKSEETPPPSPPASHFNLRWCASYFASCSIKNGEHSVFTPNICTWIANPTHLPIIIAYIFYKLVGPLFCGTEPPLHG